MSRLGGMRLIRNLLPGSYGNSKVKYLGLMAFGLVGVIGCNTSGGPPVPPCPAPSEAAYMELGDAGECCPGIIEYMGRVELLCEALDEIRDD